MLRRGAERLSGYGDLTLCRGVAGGNDGTTVGSAEAAVQSNERPIQKAHFSAGFFNGIDPLQTFAPKRSGPSTMFAVRSGLRRRH